MRTQRKRRKAVVLRKNSKKMRKKHVLETKHPFDAGYDLGYNNGYNAAYQRIEQELRTRYEEGYAQGRYVGGEKIVDELLPHDVILPEVSLHQIIAAGIHQMREHFHQLLSPLEIRNRMLQALEQQHAFSLVRIGDGELLTLSQELVFNTDEIKQRGSFLNYAGVSVPDLIARDQLAESIRKASVVGIPKLRIEHFLPLLIPVFKAHHIDYKQLVLTYSTINYVLCTDHLLPGILQQRRILVIGNEAQPLTQLLQSLGYQVERPIDRVAGVHDISRVLKESLTRQYDIALVSAGVAAVIITEKIASEQGKVAIDFGHLANALIKREVTLT